jgi:hypothetical protein
MRREWEIHDFYLRLTGFAQSCFCQLQYECKVFEQLNVLN